MRCLTAGAASALLSFFLLLLGACAGSGPSSAPAAPATFVPAATVELPPPEPREFRAAWVATVAHIDWPSQPGLAPEAKRPEARPLLDRAVAIGLNALILQVHPAADAFYASALEPWSEYLTGTQDRAPVPAWDPLAWWVGEAQARVIELHVWLNPYPVKAGDADRPFPDDAACARYLQGGGTLARDDWGAAAGRRVPH